MKNPIKVFLDPEIYPVRVLVWIGKWDDAAVRKFALQCKLWDGTDEFVELPGNEAGAHYAFPLGSLIWLPHVPRTAADYGTLVHEVNHATNHVARLLGFDLDEASDEFFSYFAGYLVAGVLTEIRK